MERCQFPHSSKEWTEADSYFQGYIGASFSKYDSAWDFWLKNNAQCRMNHAKLLINLGLMTKSTTRKFGRAWMCTSDSVAMTQGASMALGNFISTISNFLWKRAGNILWKILKRHFAVINYLVSLRGRLYVNCPNFETEPEKTTTVGCETATGIYFGTVDAKCINLNILLMGSTNITPFAHN